MCLFEYQRGRGFLIDTAICVSISCLPLSLSNIQLLRLANVKYSCNLQCALFLPLPLSAGTQPLVMRVKLRQLSQCKSCQQEVPLSSCFLLLPLTVLWLCISFLDCLQSWFCSLAKQKMLHCWKSLLQLMWGRGTRRENWDRGKALTLSTFSSSASCRISSARSQILLLTIYLQIRRK